MDVKMMVAEESETGKLVIPGAGSDSGSRHVPLETGRRGGLAEQTEKSLGVGQSEMEMDCDLICIDFFLRHISNLYPLWGEYGDNLMFHLAQIYGAISKEELSPYLQIMECVGLEMSEEMKRDAEKAACGDFGLKTRSSSTFGDSQEYPLDVEKCDPQVFTCAISHLDSYREWLDGMLTRPDCGLESVSQALEEGLEGHIGRPISEWRPAKLSGEPELPLVYQAYVTMEVRRGGDFLQSGKPLEERSPGGAEKTVFPGNGGKSCVSQSSPSKTGNEVGVTYEKNRDRWVAVWTENGIRRSRIFNVKQYGYDVAREMAIQYRREQLANVSSKAPTGTPVQAVRNNKRSRRSIETGVRSGKTSPSAYSTRNSASDVVSLQNPEFEVFYDQERDSWVCRSMANALEQETMFSVEEFGMERARNLAIEKAGGSLDETSSFTPTKRISSRTSAPKGVAVTPRRKDSQGADGGAFGVSEGQLPSSSFRIRIATNASGPKTEPVPGQVGGGVQLFSEHGTGGGGRSESRKSASGEEFLVYHGKKYYFGPVIEGIRYDKIQNRWVTGYVGQDGRKRYKYFSIGAYGFEGSRQLAIEYREGMYSSTKGVDRLCEFLQTVIQGFPAYEDGVLQDVSFEDLTIHKGNLKDGSERQYLCVPSKGDFLVTTPADQEDERVSSLINRYKSVLQNNGGREEHLLKESILACSRSDLKSPSSSALANKLPPQGPAVSAPTSFFPQETKGPKATTNSLNETEVMGAGDADRARLEGRVEELVKTSTISTEESLTQGTKQEEVPPEPGDGGGEEENSAGNGPETTGLDCGQDIEESCDSPGSSASVQDYVTIMHGDSMFVETEDKSSPGGQRRLFVGPQVDGVSFNPAVNRWVTQYSLDGVPMTKNFSVKSHGFEKSRYLAIQWRTKYNGEPPQLGRLLEALQDQGIEYPPK